MYIVNTQKVEQMTKKIILFFIVSGLLLLSFELVSCTKEIVQKEVKISIDDPEKILSLNNMIIGKTYISKNYKIVIVEPNAKTDYKIKIIKSNNNVDPNMEIVDPNISNPTGDEMIDNSVPDDVSKDIKKFIKTIEKNSVK